MDELEVLIEQIDELFSQGIVDEDDAFELAQVAGMAQRLGADPVALAKIEVWRNGPGQELLELAWKDLDVQELIDDIEGMADGQTDESLLEDALYEFDEVVAAAIWCRRRDVVLQAAQQIAQTIRLIPDSFAPLSNLGSEMARLPTVAQDSDLYGFWFAVADAGQWGD
ncbi:MAG: hypothetical protein HN348_28085 [Proteobacteria bacterium]|jgi:hypothetical protein|nr:hypothetical protein [Pseudomonadota bacterium]